jgi:hypothetical protein
LSLFADTARRLRGVCFLTASSSQEEREIAMKLSRVVTAAALAAVAGVASAGPTQLGTGPGSYTFTDDHDKGYFVELGPGTYTFSGEITSQGFDLTEVWLSKSKDHNPFGSNDLQLFTEVNARDWAEAPKMLTLTKTTDIFVDVNTHLGKLTNGSYTGMLTVSAVPEPATSALLLAGIGLLGFMGLRRKRG